MRITIDVICKFLSEINAIYINHYYNNKKLYITYSILSKQYTKRWDKLKKYIKFKKQDVNCITSYHKKYTEDDIQNILNKIGFTLCGKYTKLHDAHEIKCNYCNTIIKRTLEQFIYYIKSPCNCIRKTNRETRINTIRKSIINENRVDIISENKHNFLLRCKSCYRQFIRNVCTESSYCKICTKASSRINNKKIFLDFVYYEDICRKLTNNIRSKYNIYHSDETMCIDHKFSISKGFENNIPPYIICHPNNLHFITNIDNRKKYNNCNISIQDLYISFGKWLSDNLNYLNEL